MEEKKYMFWKYDLFPYLLWGEMDGDIDGEGWAKSKLYVGSRFKVQFIMNGDKGRVLGVTLDAIRNAYRKFMDDTNEIWVEEVKNILKAFDVKEIT